MRKGVSSGPSSENPASCRRAQNTSTAASPALRGSITACTTTGGLSSGMREKRLSQRLTIAAATVATMTGAISYAPDLTRALHAIEEVAKPRSAVVTSGVPRSRRVLQVVRTPRGHLLFFVRGARAELLGLQVARSRAGGYIDALALGLGEGLAYLRYEIVSRAPHQH